MESSGKIKHTFIGHVLAVDIHGSPAYNKVRPKKKKINKTQQLLVNQRFNLLNSVLKEHGASGDCQSYCIKWELRFI